MLQLYVLSRASPTTVILVLLRRPPIHPVLKSADSYSALSMIF